MEEKQILVKNLNINYKLFKGEKPFDVAQDKTLLVLHGWGSSSQRWQQVAELLSQKNFLIIIPDLPGFGKSQEPTNAWSLDNYVEWVKEFSDTIPQLQDRFYLLGHSFGGAVASKFSIKYNQKIEKLFLISASCIREKNLKKSILRQFSKLSKILFFLPFYDTVRKAFYKFIVGDNDSDYLNVNGIMRQSFLKIISEDLSQKLYFIKNPTIIIWGDKDELTPLYQAKIINKKIINSKLIIIPGGKHALQISIPEILTEKILENLPH
ncbi:MAG: hypothetical protein A3C58_00540 [Candidatus Staskawiczbacteria bacterium RIFCSPHIGHO2_02_FULL_34_10]|uniref:AB hydrolase-1 domain-containing protein n=1 Tax=Candidatus Staskawiczbacteria bacterium RIFCSPHIGHO2_02_FULL_34_10 TaxID=1802205 RepID=A0A1G2HU25_9BACT|nr:MAG: hypothetical protein A3C58_00540 [Candidatus Staskawiczbacteria bacterium RIFCSPHIGHO2_02_FULL_34_10]